MIKNLVVNPDLYNVAFLIYNDIDMKLDKIKSNIRAVPKSKMKLSSINGRDMLMIEKSFYEVGMDEGMKFIIDNDLKEHIYWDCNGSLVPCGYYSVGVATSFSDDIKDSVEFSAKVRRDLDVNYYSTYDYISKTYGIFLEGNNHEELVSKFNLFLKNNDIYPFINIDVTSRYGKLLRKSYPMLQKEK